MKKSFSGHFLFIFFAIFFSSCDPYSNLPGQPRPDAFKFSIKNETKSVLSAKLIVCEIPRINASYEDHYFIPDSIYKLLNETRSSEFGTQSNIKQGCFSTVYNLVPFSTPEVFIGDPRYEILSEYIYDKYFSFILTISSGNDVVYRVVGWDVPDVDMEKYSINDKMYGYYSTAKEDYINSDGVIMFYPKLTSKLFPDGINTDFISSLTYYLKVIPSGIEFVEFNSFSLYVDDKIFWKTY